MPDRFCIHCGAKLSDFPRSPASEKNKLPPFSPREQDVIALILAGYTEGQMAETLFLTVGTVKTYKRNIFKKLGIHSRRELFAAMYQQQMNITKGKLPAGRTKPRSLFCKGCGQVLPPQAQYCGACGKKV